MNNKNEPMRDQYNLDGMLLVISGPSGVGKGTVCKELLKDCPQLKLSISVTTRNPRQGEEEGVHYFFRTREQFQQMIQENALLEYANVYGEDYYGTPKDYVHEQLANGNDVVLEIDVAGALQVKKNFPKAVLVFIAPPSVYELERRLRLRGTEEEETVQERLRIAQEELKKIGNYDYVVVNDFVARAKNKVKTILAAERCRTENNIDIIVKLTGRA